MPPEKAQWAELFTEVVTAGTCTGCAACVIVCPYDVLGYDDSEGRYRPFHVEEAGGPEDCTHGQRGCTLCTRACPRFRAWEVEADTHLFGRARNEDELYGIAEEVSLVRATDPELAAVGQDGGLVSALLVYALEHDVIDAALVNFLEGDGRSWKAASLGVRAATATTCCAPPALATPIRRTRWHMAKRSRQARSGWRSSAWAVRPPRRRC